MLAYDAPGFGQSYIENPEKLSIPFLVETAKAVLDDHGIDTFHLIGHSMGGLTSLVLAHELQDRVLSFIDSEGNVAPEDCFLSRQIITHFHQNADAFMQSFETRVPSAILLASPLCCVAASQSAEFLHPARV